jgi:hypothetical protein
VPRLASRTLPDVRASVDDQVVVVVVVEDAKSVPIGKRRR